MPAKATEPGVPIPKQVVPVRRRKQVVRIFPVLFKLLNVADSIKITPTEKTEIIKYFKEFLLQEDICNEKNFELYQLRNVGFIMERLTGYYLFKLTKTKRYREVLTRQFDKRAQNLSAILRQRIMSKA